MKFPHRTADSFSGLSIVYKMGILLCILFIVPLLIFLFCNYYYMETAMKNQAIFSYQRIFNQTVSFLETKTADVKNIVQMISSDDTLQELVSTSNQHYRKNIGNWMIATETIKSILFTTFSSPDISSIRLFMNEGPASVEETAEFKNMETAKKTGWYHKLDTSANGFVWFPSDYMSWAEEKQISFIHIISDKNKINHTLGIIKADIPEKLFQNILSQAAVTKNSTVLLVNRSQEIISLYGQELFHQPENLRELLDVHGSAASGELREIMFQDEKYLIGVSEIHTSDWRLLFLVPYRDILALGIQSRDQNLLALILLILTTVPIVCLLANTTTKRIRTLISQMKTVATGNFDVEILPSGTDEIGQLTHNFNYMLTKMTIALDEQYHLGKELENSELKILQAQINPHFLYNTLEMIHWMAIQSDADDINRVVESLAKFYKLSLSRGSSFVTIRAELSHVQEYTKIQNMRFEDSIMLLVDVPDLLMDYEILKIVFQPLVENAILHGIREKEGEQGRILLTGRMTDGVILFSVADDGIGMDSETLNQLFDTDAGGYGVKNINDRLKLTYGPRYGLTYESTIGLGTTVYVRIPAESGRKP